MPALDVADVLDDPDFATTITVARTAVTGMDRGREILAAAAPVTLSAVVQPASSRDLQRLPDAALSAGAITIWARFPFASDASFVPATDTTPAVAGTKADLVSWRGSDYTVMTVDDWGEFGAGYYRALATRRSVP